MGSKRKPRTKTFNSLTDVVNHLTEEQARVQQEDAAWCSQVKELTGHDPRKPISPLDVVKIVQHVFDRRYVKRGEE